MSELHLLIESRISTVPGIRRRHGLPFTADACQAAIDKCVNKAERMDRKGVAMQWCVWAVNDAGSSQFAPAAYGENRTAMSMGWALPTMGVK